MFMFVVMFMFMFRSSTGLNVAVELRQKTIMNPPSNKREGGGGPRILSDPGSRIVDLQQCGRHSNRCSDRIRPLEEWLHQTCTPPRGELDRSAPGVFRVYLMVVFEG